MLPKQPPSTSSTFLKARNQKPTKFAFDLFEPPLSNLSTLAHLRLSSNDELSVTPSNGDQQTLTKKARSDRYVLHGDFEWWRSIISTKAASFTN